MFDLKGLPRELRDEIYKNMLVRKPLRVLSKVVMVPCDSLEEETAIRNEQDDYLSIERTSTLNSTVRLRSTSMLDRGCDNIDNLHGKTYYRDEDESDPPSVNIFFTDRQTYSEAWPIFYERNSFHFTHPFNNWDSIVTCCAFLRDRPHALKHIRSIKLILGRHGFRSVWNNVLLRKWKSLCDKLSQKMALQTLELVIRGYCVPPSSEDTGEGSVGQPAECTKLLLKITGLRELVVKMVYRKPWHDDLQGCVDFVQLLRSKMVLGGEELGPERVTVDKNKVVIESTAITPKGKRLCVEAA
ncbi:hypothetical protein MMC28_004720 [Mycoblastus sanguinarius]|nr:hypothetical protein [Mycoblastus sanguinarius]